MTKSARSGSNPLKALTVGIGFFVLAAAVGGGEPVMAQSGSAYDFKAIHDGSDARYGKKVWDVTVGGGLAVKPTFEGSDHYTVAPVPYVNITYDDMISLSAKGLDAYWHHDNFRIGGGLTYNGGRKDSDGNGIFDQGDDRLRGLGNIDAALGVRAFASYDFGPAKFDGSVTKFTGSNNDGVVVNVGASLPYRLTDRLTVTPRVGATWANQDYMQTFFGVTSTQAANSRFSQFNANSGFKDVGAGVNLNYRFDQHWFIGVNADVKELTGDAAKSPISFSNTQAIFMTMVGYHF